MFYMNEKVVATNRTNKNNKTFIKKEKPMKKVETEVVKLVTTTEFSLEEKQQIINAQTGMTVNTHERIVVDKAIEHNQKDFKIDRKLAAEEVAEARIRNLKAPKIEVKEGLMVIDNCKVVDTLPGAKFKVQVGPNVVLCYLNGKLRQNKINITIGDEVRVEMSTYDMHNGRITWRF